MLTYDFNLGVRTLAGLRAGDVLSKADVTRLRLELVQTEVEEHSDGQVGTTEELDNGLGLKVGLVDGLVHLVRVDHVRIDGSEAEGWTEDDFSRHLGTPSEREVLTEDLHEVRWLGHDVWTFFYRGVLQEFSLRDP